MLVKLEEEDFDKYADFAYSLALNQEKSGYPTYADGIKTKEDFMKMERRAFSGESDEILLFKYEGRVEGWIHYFYLEEDRYIETCACNINKETKIALKEFLEYMRREYTGCEIDLGFPKCNRDAVDFLENNGFECIEESCNNVCFLDEYKILPESGAVVRVNDKNYAEFRKIHSLHDEEMYWNSDRIQGHLDRWKIYLYYDQGNPAGAVYFMDAEIMLEIFGVDLVDDVCQDEIFKALIINALNEGKRMGAKYLTFFAEKNRQEILSNLGFRYIGEYVCYRKELR